MTRYRKKPEYIIAKQWKGFMDSESQGMGCNPIGAHIKILAPEGTKCKGCGADYSDHAEMLLSGGWAKVCRGSYIITNKDDSKDLLGKEYFESNYDAV